MEKIAKSNANSGEGDDKPGDSGDSGDSGDDDDDDDKPGDGGSADLNPDKQTPTQYIAELESTLPMEIIPDDD
jgi:hypothetical protein